MSEFFISEHITPNPHTSFFREFMSHIHIARDLLKAHLDPDVKKMMRWNTLKMSDLDFVDPDTQTEHPHGNMLYTCDIDKKGTFIYILVKLLLEPDPNLSFKFFEHNSEILKQHMEQRSKKDKNKPLPDVVNLCIYIGKENPYPYPLDA